MNKNFLSGAIAAVLMTPAAVSSVQAAENDGVAELREQVERLKAEVDYLKENAKATRKEAAVNAVDVSTLKTNTSKFTWNGDFRYRAEFISQKAGTSAVDEEHTRNRDRVRVRFGVTTKVNDSITAKLQLATNSGNGDPRSTNQTLGEDFTRKGMAIDQAYVDWKAASFLNVQLGKTPIPWTTTASYMWDKDITPEGIAVKFAKGNLFGGVYYDWLNERSSFANSGNRSDSKLVVAQFGIKQPIGKTSLTAAIGYFDTVNVKNEVVAAASPCTAAVNSTFFGATANGNTTTTSGGCTTLSSDFTNWNALVQYDFFAGKFPMSVFVDYMKNNDAVVNAAAGKTLDKALAFGVTFNKASAAKSWEVGVVYQANEKDAVFGQFVDSDFGDGKTDANGWVIKGAYVPAANWTIAGTYFINKLNNDVNTALNKDLAYKRLQLDLNFKF